jgi:hypothetical protein
VQQAVTCWRHIVRSKHMLFRRIMQLHGSMSKPATATAISSPHLRLPSQLPDEGQEAMAEVRVSFVMATPRWRPSTRCSQRTRRTARSCCGTWGSSGARCPAGGAPAPPSSWRRRSSAPPTAPPLPQTPLAPFCSGASQRPLVHHCHDVLTGSSSRSCSIATGEVISFCKMQTCGPCLPMLVAVVLGVRAS